MFHAALLPALVLLVLWMLVARWQSRSFHPVLEPMSRGGQAVAALSTLGIVALLAGVFTGKLLAVEAAASACMVLVLAALGTRAISLEGWKALLAQTLALSGALIALLVGATVFSLVFRLLGADRWLTSLLLESTWPPLGTAMGVLLLVAACAWVLDAFEMIFVVIPFVAPPLIVLLGDAQQAAVLLLMVLQLSFVLPPMGYAVMMARTHALQTLTLRALAAALAPFIGVQCVVLAVVFLVPASVHLMDVPVEEAVALPERDLEEQMRAMVEAPAGSDVPTPEPEIPVPQEGAAQSR